MHIHQCPVCCALPAGQSRGGWCAAPKPCVPARRETLLDVHSAPPWRSLNPPPVAMCRARVDWSSRQKRHAGHQRTLSLYTPPCFCGHVKSQVLLVHSQVGSSPAVTRHAGHQGTLRCTAPPVLWPCAQPSPGKDKNQAPEAPYRPRRSPTTCASHHARLSLRNCTHCTHAPSQPKLHPLHTRAEPVVVAAVRRRVVVVLVAQGGHGALRLWRERWTQLLTRSRSMEEILETDGRGPL